MIGIVDNEVDFLDVAEERAQQRGMSLKTTNDIEESIKWVRDREISILLADLRMSESGLNVIERAKQLNDISAFVLTAFEPSHEEKAQAQKLGVQIYDKEHFTDLLSRVEEIIHLKEIEHSTSDSNSEAVSRVAHEAEALLLGWLNSLKDRESKTIFYGGRAYSVTEVIDEIARHTPVGDAHLELFIKVLRKGVRL